MNRRLSARMGILFSALLMILIVSLTAFADTAIPNGDSSGISENRTDDGFLAVDPSVTLFKQIVFRNPDGEQVRFPNISYTYSIRSAEEDIEAAVTDSQGNSVSIKPGPIDAVSPDERTRSITLTDNKYAASSASGTAADVGSVTFTFSDLTKFTQPGVYRYVISDTTDDTALASCGIERSADYTDSRNLDVYVRRDPDTSNMEIYGYVLTDSTISDITPSADKSDGWVLDEDDTDMKDVDIYQTYNVRVGKRVSGALADTSHKFPFTVTLANSAETAVTKCDVRTNGSQADTGNVTHDSINNTVYISSDGEYVTGGIADGGIVTITGIPKSAAVYVKEQNDTYEEYTAAADIDGAAVTINNGETGVTLAQADWAELDEAVEVNAPTTQTITFTNRLDEISPTGLFLRTAPYILMMTAATGLAFFVVARRIKNR